MEGKQRAEEMEGKIEAKEKQGKKEAKVKQGIRTKEAKVKQRKQEAKEKKRQTQDAKRKKVSNQEGEWKRQRGKRYKDKVSGKDSGKLSMLELKQMPRTWPLLMGLPQRCFGGEIKHHMIIFQEKDKVERMERRSEKTRLDAERRNNTGYLDAERWIQTRNTYSNTCFFPQQNRTVLKWAKDSQALSSWRSIKTNLTKVVQQKKRGVFCECSWCSLVEGSFNFHLSAKTQSLAVAKWQGI